jgi:hypothetical protein
LEYCHQRLIAGAALAALRELFQRFIKKSHVVLLSLLCRVEIR